MVCSSQNYHFTSQYFYFMMLWCFFKYYIYIFGVNCSFKKVRGVEGMMNVLGGLQSANYDD